MVTAAAFPVRPLFDRVFVEETERALKYAIELPDSAKGIRPKHFKVVAIGTGMIGPDGSAIPTPFKVGDTVMVSHRTQGEAVTIMGRTIIAIREQDVLGVVTDE